VSALTPLARSLPRLPGKVPGGLALVAAIRGAGIAVGQWGDGFMLLRVFPEDEGQPDIPLTPLLSRDEIAVLAEGALTDPRVKTWPLITNVLALGVLLADVPRPPEAEAEPVQPPSSPPAAPVAVLEAAA